MPHEDAHHERRLAPHAVAVWLVAIDDVAPSVWARADAALAADERIRAARFRDDASRAQFVAGRALARRMLSYFAGAPRNWRFRARAHGRLTIDAAAPPFVFNLSHCAGLVACAVAAEGEIGVDVERLAPAADFDALARDHFSAREGARVAALEGEAQAEAFFAYWTLKEAYAKARGLGLSLDTRAFAFDLGPPIALRFGESARHGLGDDATRWRFLRLAPTPATRLALAVAAPLDVRDARLQWADLAACLEPNVPPFVARPAPP